MKSIRKQKEFDNLRKNGKRYKQTILDLVVAKTEGISCSDKKDFKLAVITSKRIGNAVKRNKVRRWIKEWFRQTEYNILLGTNYLVITKKGIYQAGRETIIRELKDALTEYKQNFK